MSSGSGTARYLYPSVSQPRAILKYIFSFTGLVDLLSFLPHYLPFFFPAGAIAFRMFRIIRIFRLFRINAYYDALNVITEVIVSKKQQLFSSVFIIIMLMLGSSLCMYSLEHEAQPEVFANAFSGIWWAASTLLTVGYGDIYPVTILGKLFGIFIAFLGVGIVAIPTGIISAGFVDQYSRIKRMSEYGQESAIHFIKIHLTPHDSWVNHTISQLQLPDRVIVAAILRNHRLLVPRGNMALQAGDDMVLGAESFHDDGEHIRLKEMVHAEKSSLDRTAHPGTGDLPPVHHRSGSPQQAGADPQREHDPAGGGHRGPLYPDPCDGRDGDRAVNHWTFSPFPHIIGTVILFPNLKSERTFHT